ncbi:MAG TPA: secondary thiamine-phosphate synthase enzyme YjbQ [Coriobacteriia bacterium]|nr:secondary thiamine-phosphate synthase enzyme YjbQ [Coriobacteriia bacterium]
MHFELRTSSREEFVDVTRHVQEAVRIAGIERGAALIFCPHTTAAVTINENADPDVTLDLVDGLARIAPSTAHWRHREGNSDGHLKSSLVGPSLLVPVEDGRLALGTWQGVYFCEFDGPRSRRFSVTLLEGL